jgi:iron complex transport system substrate-binding protein
MRTQTSLPIIALVLACLIIGPFTALAGEVTFKDHYGNTVTLNKPAERVVTIPKPAPSMFMAVDGGCRKLAGIHPSSMAAIKEGIMKDIFPAAVNINTSVGSKGGYVPNVEEMVRLKPDIVFQWGNRGAGIVDPIKNAGLKVALVKYGNQQALETMLTAFGAVSGNDEKAAGIIGWHRETLEMLKKEIASVPQDKKPRVMYFIRALSELKAAGGDTYHSLCIDIAGGVNPAAELSDYKAVNAEQVIAWDPEVIFLNNFEPKLSPKDLYDNPLLAGVSAIKNRRVYKAPLGGYRWDPPNQESPLMWKWLAMVFYPDKFQWDLRAELKDKYAILYNYKVSDDQVDAIFRMDMHMDSAHYDQFGRK